MKNKLIMFGIFMAGIIFTTVLITKNDSYNNQPTGKDYINIVKDGNYNIVCYKKGCPYCENSKKTVLEAYKKSHTTTFFVDVDSRYGKEIIKKYNITKAASIIVVRDNFAKVSRYALKDVNGHIGPNQSKIKEAFNDSKN